MKNSWNLIKVQKLFKKPFFDLMFMAQKIHRKYFNPFQIQISTLVSIKTGLCPEDCKYCPQSIHYKTNIKYKKLLDYKKVIILANKAKNSGASRFCMGAAWKKVNDRDLPYLKKIIMEVKSLGMETCMTLGMLNQKQALYLAKVGLDYYNHNLDTSKEFYKNIITTRSYEDRLNTIKKVRNAGIKLCCGGIFGLGENIIDRCKLLIQLANLPTPPESIPINMLIKVKGTPLENNKEIEPFEFIKTIAITRIMMPISWIRLSAGREKMNEQTQALCFMAGANSIFYGKKLLTANNNSKSKDLLLFKKLGLNFNINNK